MKMKLFMLSISVCLLNLETNAQKWIDLGRSDTFFTSPGASLGQLVIDNDQNIYATGGVYNANYQYDVAKWNASKWENLGDTANLLNATSQISTMCVDTNNHIYASGVMRNSLGNFIVYKWDGTSWQELGDGIPVIGYYANPSAMCVDKNNNNVYIAAGDDLDERPQIYKWDGTSWTVVGGSQSPFRSFSMINILDIDVDSIGNLYVASNNYDNNGEYYLLKWDGTTWTEMGSANNRFNGKINTITFDKNGQLYAAGSFYDTLTVNGVLQNYMYVAKWENDEWVKVASANDTINFNREIKSIVSDYNNNLYIGGDFNNSNFEYYIAKWDGNMWSKLDSDSSEINMGSGAVNALATDKYNNIYASGFIKNETSDHPIVAMWNGGRIDSVDVKVKNDLPATISTKSGTLPLEAKVFLPSARQEVNWSISDGTIASISSEGVVTAIKDGTVWAKAVSVMALDIADSIQITITNQTVSVNEIKESLSFSIYPNPTHDKLNLEFNTLNSNYSIHIYDVVGREVLTNEVNTNISNKVIIDLNKFSKGEYILKVKSENMVETTKFVKS